MKRRDFIRSSGLAALAAAPAMADAGTSEKNRPIRWKMVTAWPANFPGVGVSAQRLAERIGVMSGGRLSIKVYAAGELVPAFEVFDAVSRGTAEMGHAASHYWAGKIPAVSFFGGVPFGMTCDEINAWLYHGGGLQLWQEIYAPFGLLPLPVGNAGVQMAGWFRKEIHSVADFKGLKVRIAGLGGEVLRRLGATAVTMPVSEIFTSLQSGTIDATEFVGPYSDQALGLYRAAKYYYYPGWHEPASTLECTINRKALEQLPTDLQAVVTTACQATNMDLFAEYTARNATALETLVGQHGVQLREFSPAVLVALQGASAEVLADMAEKDPVTEKVYISFQSFLKQVGCWTDISEYAYLKARNTAAGLQSLVQAPCNDQ